MSGFRHKITRTWHGRRRFRVHCTCGWQYRNADTDRIAIAESAHRLGVRAAA